MRWLLLLACVLCLLSCENLTNRLHSGVLACGDAAREGGPWIKVLDPEGKELPAGELLDARILELSPDGDLPAALPVSQKNCVNTRGASSLVIRSLAQGRSWSVLLQPQEFSGAEVRLQDNSQARVQLLCPKPWIHKGRFELPLDIKAPAGLDAWTFAPTLQDGEGRRREENHAFLQADSSLTWPEAWADGPGTLTLRQRNLLQNPRSALAEVEESCDFVIDRQKPQLKLTPTPEAGRELDMQPGALLRVAIDDPHAAGLQWCMQSPDRATCEAPEAWQSAAREISVPMPEQGRWILKVRAQDFAGNDAEPLEQVIDVVRRDLLESISSRVAQALAEKTEQGWDASISLLRALADFGRLTIAKEQEQVRGKIVDAILGVVPSLHEYQRVTLPSQGLRSWAWSDGGQSGWIVLSATDLSIWSAAGRKLGSTAVPDSSTADWSPSQKAIALVTADELWVLRLSAFQWAEPVKLRWKDHDLSEPEDLQWIPGQAQLLVRDGEYDPAIIELGREGLSLGSRLPSEDTKQAVISPTGDQIATVDGNQIVKVWSLVAGVWTVIDQHEFSVAGLSFASISNTNRLILLLKDGRMITWGPGLLWKETDAGVPGEIPSEDSPLRNVPRVQSWGDGSAGIVERAGRFYQWSTDPGKTLQPLKLSGLDGDRLQNWRVDPCQEGLWMQDDRQISYWEPKGGDDSSFEKRGAWPVDNLQLTMFSVLCDADQKRLITTAGDRLRFWAQRGPLTQVQADKTTVVVSRFESGPGNEETLFTAGFDGTIRLWSPTGRKLQEWKGHTGQINEVRYLPEWQLFASSAEDYTTRLWTPDGQPDAQLSLLGQGSSTWRDAALAFDTRTMLTAGRGRIAVWSIKDNRKELTITISLPAGERANFNPLVRLPGAARILVRLKKGHVWRAVVVQPDGALVTEPGLPALERLNWLEWTPDGSRLALSDAQQKLSLYHYEAGRWVPDSLTTPPPTGLMHLAFTPDGQGFAAISASKKLVLGRWAAGQWILQPEISLNSAAADRGLLWSKDSTRLVYAQAGQIFVRDREGRLLHQFQAFPGRDPLASLGLNQDAEVLALGLGPQVRIVDLNLKRLQAQLCSWLDAWIKGPDAPPELSLLCR